MKTPAAFRWLARAAVWVFYRVHRVGAPLPEGPVLLVANHPNALLDPAVVWTTAGRDLRFLAKSTLFDLPVVGPLFTAAGAIPVYRRVDQGVDVSKNAEMFAAVGKALADGDVVCLFPEGRTHSTGRLEELKTGAARIALASESAGTRVSLVAVGLNFDENQAFRSDVTVAFGQPFSGADLSASGLDDREQADQLTGRIAERLRALLVEAHPDDEAQIVARIERLYRSARALPLDPESRLARRRAIADGIVRVRERSPDRYEAIAIQVRNYDEVLRRFGLSDEDVDREIGPDAVIRFVVRESVFALVLVPLDLLARLAFAVPYLVTDLLARRQPFREVRATSKIVGGAMIYAAWMAAVSMAIGWWLGPVAGLACAAALPLIGLAGLRAIEHDRQVVAVARSYLLGRLAPGRLRRRLTRRRGELARLLEDAYSWVQEADASAAGAMGNGHALGE